MARFTPIQGRKLEWEPSFRPDPIQVYFRGLFSPIPKVLVIGEYGETDFIEIQLVEDKGKTLTKALDGCVVRLLKRWENKQFDGRMAIFSRLKIIFGERDKVYRIRATWYEKRGVNTASDSSDFVEICSILSDTFTIRSTKRVGISQGLSSPKEAAEEEDNEGEDVPHAEQHRKRKRSADDVVDGEEHPHHQPHNSLSQIPQQQTEISQQQTIFTHFPGPRDHPPGPILPPLPSGPPMYTNFNPYQHGAPQLHLGVHATPSSSSPSQSQTSLTHTSTPPLSMTGPFGGEIPPGFQTLIHSIMQQTPQQQYQQQIQHISMPQPQPQYQQPQQQSQPQYQQHQPQSQLQYQQQKPQNISKQQPATKPQQTIQQQQVMILSTTLPLTHPQPDYPPQQSQPNVQTTPLPVLSTTIPPSKQSEQIDAKKDESGLILK